MVAARIFRGTVARVNVPPDLVDVPPCVAVGRVKRGRSRSVGGNVTLGVAVDYAESHTSEKFHSACYGFANLRFR
jgi:hypothetical protein